VAFMSWRGGVGWAVFVGLELFAWVAGSIGLRFPQSLCPYIPTRPKRKKLQPPVLSALFSLV